ncbi:SpoVG family protein [Alienimonas chondri]|uniref:Septation protein SpoVG n=1 Tax=Alienimonas chondri TaxID=2681879 RepID=A0ABX1VEH5_9PLAN|nr:SpoVG family protein [Alienimonas chondri]NNJ26459.1 putative septation protein SpoVG [Alienimonas chondri]
MKITDVRVKLAPGADAAGGEAGRLLAFCSITLDGCFVVRDLKLIRGEQGAFVAMPSRKITARCDECGGKNPLRANYCGDCGAAQNDPESTSGGDGRQKLYADIAHPINAGCRTELESSVVAAWEQERVLAASPEYVCRYDECDVGEPAPGRGAGATSSKPHHLPNVPGVVRRLDGATPLRSGPATLRPNRSPLRTARRGEAAGAFGDGL